MASHAQVINPTVYQHRTELNVTALANGWARIRLPDDPTGVALDPVLFAIWSAANGHTPAQVAQATRLSTYLAACGLTVLQRAGLLQGQGDALPSRTNDLLEPDLTVSAVIVHRHAEAALEDCVISVSNQAYPSRIEIVVVSPYHVTLDGEQVRVESCTVNALARTLSGQLAQATGQAVLVLDSRLNLAPGFLAEGVRVLRVHSDVVAVAPRVMWQRWPAFVAHMGDWRYEPNTTPNPYAGQLDVGQFARHWYESPAVNLAAALLARQALQGASVLPEGDDLDRLGVDWSYQVRLEGGRVLAAAQALGYGPWPGEATSVLGKRPQGYERLRALEPPDPGAMLYEGAPALTLDNVRGVYSHYPAIAPRPMRQRVAFFGRETSRRQALFHELAAMCEVSWIEPRDKEDKVLYEQCEAADLIITTAGCLREFEWLKYVPRPIVVDAQPPVSRDESPPEWLLHLDALLCASQEERRYWLAQFIVLGDRHPQDLVMVVPPDLPGQTHLAPLTRLCRQPRFAPAREKLLFLEPEPVQPLPTPPWALPAKAWQSFSRRGLGATVREVGHYFQWKVGL